MTMVPIALTSLLVRSHQEMARGEPGLDAERLWMLPVSPTPSVSTLPWDGDEVPVVLAERLTMDFFGSAAAAQGQIVLWEQAEINVRLSVVVEDTHHFGYDLPEPHLMCVPASIGGYGLGAAAAVLVVSAEIWTPTCASRSCRLRSSQDRDEGAPTA